MNSFFSRVFSMHPLAMIAGVCLIALTIPAYRLLDAERANVGAVPREIATTRAAVLAQVSRVLDGDPQGKTADEQMPLRLLVIAEIDRQGSQLRGTADARLASIEKRTFGLVGTVVSSANARVADTLKRADRALDSLEELRKDLQPTLQNAQTMTANAATITAQVSDALPLFLDCDHNADCAFNRYVGAARGVENAARNFGAVSLDVKNALPQSIAIWQGIGTNVGGITGNIKRLTTPHWYDRALGYGLSFGSFYRDLNPGYNAAAGIRGLFTKHKEQ